MTDSPIMLKQAIPYIRMYKGKVFVVKVGGRVVGRKRRGENEVRLALAQRIRSSLALAGFQSAVGDL